MSRSVRIAIGVALVLVLLGAGSAYAVSRWNQREAPGDWNAVVRGGECVAGQFREVVRDVAGLLRPDSARPASSDGSDGAGQAADGPSGQDGGDSRDAASNPGSGSPVGSLLAEGREFLESLGNGVPRLDEPATGRGGGC